MKNNDTGEFELVLGNRHLLSGFFIVVLLFGVAFAMGYIVGRNSAPSSKLQAEKATGTTAAAEEARPQSASPAEPADTKSEAQPASADQRAESDAPAQPTTQPAREAPSASPPAAETPAAP